jgi:hypothetical protein
MSISFQLISPVSGIDLREGNFQCAAGQLAEANPDDVWVWYHRGLALEGAGRTAEAKEFFARAAGYNFNGSITALVTRDAQRKASYTKKACPERSAFKLIAPGR